MAAEPRPSEHTPQHIAAAEYLAEDLVSGSIGEDADELVLSRILGARVDPELVEFAAGAGGNLRLLAEFALGLDEEGLVRVKDGTIQLVARRVPERLLGFVMDELGLLSADGQQFLKVASAFGPTFRLEDVSRMMDRSSAALLAALDEAMAAGFVLSAEHQFAFQGEFVLRGIVESIPAPARDVLRHEAASLPRRRGPAYAVNGSAIARPEAYAVGGRGRSSRPLALIMNGDAAAGVRAAECLLASADVSPMVRADAEASLILGHFLLGSEEAARKSACVLRERGDRPDDVAALMAVTTQSNLLWRAGELSEALRLGRTAVLHSADVDPVWRMHVQLPLAGKLANLREFDRAEALIDEVDADLRALPTPAWTAAPAAMRSRLYLQSGRIGDARREAELATRAQPRDAVPMLRPLAFSVLSTVSFYMGDLPRALEYLNCAQNDVAAHAVLESVQYAWIDLLIAIKTEGPRAAAHLLSGKYQDLPEQRSLYIEVPSAAAFLIVLAHDLGEDDLARRVLATVDRLAADNADIPVIGLTALHANALANSAPEALSLIIVQSPDPLSVALATEQLAKLYSGTAGHTHSHSPEVPPEPVFSHTDDVHDKHDACWSALSDMERRIAYLVSVGLTNRQIGRQVHLSAHTVNYHLRKLYKKFGINTRVELAHGAATHLRRAAIYSMDDEDDA